MDFRKLQIFLCLADEGSFVGAAQRLNIAQSAVSIAVRKLEHELGIVLVNRDRRATRLTEEGLLLEARGRELMNHAATVEQQIAARKELMSGTVSISSPSMLATYYLPELLSTFLDAHPGVTASVTQVGTEDTQKALLDGETELGVIVAERCAPGLLESLPLKQERLCLIVTELHPFAKRAYLRLSDLRDQPLVVYEPGYFVRDVLDQLFAAQTFSPDIRVTTNFLPLILSMVRKGVGATVGVGLVAEEETDLRAIPIVPRIDVNMVLARVAGRRISIVNHSFFEWVGKQSQKDASKPPHHIDSAGLPAN
ncbi:transcriptional regulator [Luminiphilus syltensis NOR5-1B]|uniref:Transcriptional regulator n=1 Tax=Luminiphilus syltensis NOR5-1B TaxID=565045 RepID=B8KY52_9GAMM|nr:LysR family transcriptional regulator [Luminiphilus syltensis]EED35680.1 transcriptional regulator [Luminiphilus syltensis NOR5-1B]